MRKPGKGLRFADVLVIEEGSPGAGPRRVETFSFKSRDLSGLGIDDLTAQMIEDAREALSKYGERLDIRRPGLEAPVEVQRVRLIYEGGKLMPTNPEVLDAAVSETKKTIPGVEVLFQ